MDGGKKMLPLLMKSRFHLKVSTYYGRVNALLWAKASIQWRKAACRLNKQSFEDIQTFPIFLEKGGRECGLLLDRAGAVSKRYNKYDT